MSNIPDATESARLDALDAYTTTILERLHGDDLDKALAGEVQRRRWRTDAQMRALAQGVHPDDLVQALVKNGYTLTTVGIESIQLKR